MIHRHYPPVLALLLLPACTELTPPAPRPAVPDQATQTPAPQVVPPPRPAAPPPASLPVPEQPGVANRPEVRAFIAEMNRLHGFDPAALGRLFDGVHSQPKVLEAISRPYEAKPWHAYRKLFLTDTRIQGGREFRRQNAEALARAQRKYGVSPTMITAILGIESSYGQKPGNYRVIDALSTLAFDYPKRAAFFRKELVEFLLLCREEGMPPTRPVGSYAGAMGMPQFMPSSYRKLAADGDGDLRRDIWTNPADAIASVARYFAASGWQAGGPVAVPARVTAPAQARFGTAVKPSYTLSQLAALGITPGVPVAGSPKATLIRLEEESGPAFWLGFHNFYVIMRYNHSPLYAMAAHELSLRLREDPS